MTDQLSDKVQSSSSGVANQREAARLPLHIFTMGGKHHLFDPESGKFFRVDSMTAEIVSHLPRLSLREAASRLEGKHQKVKLEKAINEIANLISSEHLLSGATDIGEKPEPVDIKPRIVSMTLNLISTCNLSCIYCWNKGGSYGRMVKEKRMDAATARRAVDLMVEHSLEKDELLMDFYGGEPLLNFGVVRSTMDYCKEIESKFDRRFTYKVTTNGVELTREMTDYFDTIGISLGISIDGTKKVHNRNRPFPDGKGSYDVIRKNLDTLSNVNNIHVSARATLLPPELDMVKATKALFRLGFYDTEVEFASEPCASFNPEGYHNYSDHDVEKMKKEYLKFAKFYLKYTLYKDEAIDVGISNNLTRVLHETHRFSPCGAGSNFLCVTEEGDLYPCMGFIGMRDYKLGNVHSGFDIPRLKTFRHRMKSVIYEADECKECWARNICAGNCPANNEQHNQGIFKPYKRGCDWLKFQLEVAMWVASEIKTRKPSRLVGYEPV